MAGYVKRINDATLRVPIGGIRIGSAKYSRLAQINLRTHIITFSRYAIENVPERGRRYLVIHELAHVKEANHNKRFWQLVSDHEPRYKEIGRELDAAFKKNVISEQKQKRKGLIIQPKLFPLTHDDWEAFRDALELNPSDASAQDEQLEDYFFNQEEHLRGTFVKGDAKDEALQDDPGLYYPLDSGVVELDDSHYFECNDDELDSWHRFDNGLIHGGSDDVVDTEEFED